MQERTTTTEEDEREGVRGERFRRTRCSGKAFKGGFFLLAPAHSFWGRRGLGVGENLIPARKSRVGVSR